MTNVNENKVRQYIDSLLESMDGKEILEILVDACNEKDKYIKSKWGKHYIHKAIAEELIFNDYTVLKPQTLKTQMEIESLVETIFPHYNERQAVMFSF